jgi:hypothetical protein
MKHSRLVINNIRNFKLTLVLSAIMLIAIGMVLSVSVLTISGTLVTSSSVQEKMTALIEENVELKVKLMTIETDHLIDVKKVTSEYEATITRQEELISSIDSNLDSLEYYYTKYQYIFRDAKNAKNPIQLSHVVKLDQEAKDRNLDPHELASIIFIESGYNMQAKSSLSSARGAGQILGSTGEYIHTKLLGYDTPYSHDMALDPIKNIEMMAAYVEYLYTFNPTPYDMVKYYSGNCIGEEYQRRMYNYMMKNVGYSDKSLDV